MMTKAERAEAERKEAEDALYLDDQLRQIRAFLVDHRAPEEFLDTVDYFITENLDWVSCSGAS
jgi:hypothetical protein